MVVADSRSPPPRTPPSGSRSTTSRCRAVTDAAAATTPGAPRVGTRPAPTSASTPTSATPPRPRRHSRAPPMSCRSTPGCSASPACRWSRAPRSAPTTRRPAATRCYAGSGGVGAAEARARRRARRAAGRGARRDRGDVGGNFGTRNAFYPEFALVAWAARRVGRPVKWTCERPEAFLSDYQGRDLASRPSSRSTPTADFLALRGSDISNVGAHTVIVRAADEGRRADVQRLPHPGGAFRARAVLSNTPPTNPYRSAGRPEAMFVIERLIDLAAGKPASTASSCGGATSIPPTRMPYTNPLGMTYDSGDYAQAMDAGAGARRLGRLSERRREPRRAAASAAASALANYIEVTSGVPRECGEDHRARRTAGRRGDRHAVERPGPRDELRAARHGMARRAVRGVRLIQGDTDIVTVGGGSHSGRSMRLGRHRHRQGVRGDHRARAKRIAAHVLEAAPSRHRIRRRPLPRQGHRPLDRPVRGGARGASTATTCPSDLRGPLAAECDETVTVGGFPYGCHVCEVEVDPETGDGRDRRATPPSTTSAAPSIR